MANFHYWRHTGDNQAFGYTVRPDENGKFYAIKFKIVKNMFRFDVFREVKRVAFGRRKIAKKRALAWYHKRLPAVQKKAEREKLRQQTLEAKPKPDKFELALEKIKTINKNVADLERKIKAHQGQIKRLKTRISKLRRSRKYYLAKGTK